MNEHVLHYLNHFFTDPDQEGAKLLHAARLSLEWEEPRIEDVNFIAGYATGKYLNTFCTTVSFTQEEICLYVEKVIRNPISVQPNPNYDPLVLVRIP